MVQCRVQGYAVARQDFSRSAGTPLLISTIFGGTVDHDVGAFEIGGSVKS